MQAVFFDFDGVLVDSVDVKTEAFAELYKTYGAEITNLVVQYHLDHGGVSRYRKIQHFEECFLGRQPSEDEIQAKAGKFAQLVKSRVIASAWIPGARDALERLRNRASLFIVSGTPEDELKEIAEGRGMAGWFAAIRGAPAEKSQIVNELISDWRLVPSRCLFVGDATTDLQAATANGVAFLGIVPDDRRNPFPQEIPVVRDLLGFEPKMWLSSRAMTEIAPDQWWDN